MRTTITERGQTVVPARIRRDHHLLPQSKLEWIDDGRTIRVVPLPTDAVQAARGSTKGLRAALDRERELERDRD